VADAAKLYYRFASIVRSLQRDVDYEVDEEKRIVFPLEDGIEKVEQALGLENLYDAVAQNLVHQLQAALTAKELYTRDKDYIVANGEVKIVDEVDSILIDEARTPLIISGRVADAAQMYYKFASIVRGLRPEEDYEVDEAKRIVSPTESGIEKVERALNIENLYDGVAQNLVHQLQAALRAKELFKRDKDYIVAGGEVKIVDEFTGRILEGRRWSEGIHQAVEAKEGVKIKEENQTLATVTLQNYFRMYDKLAGMTGTAQTEAAEFANTYDLHVVPVPTHRPIARLDQGDLIYKSEEAKFGAVVDDIVERNANGQPILVGTVSVEKSERLSRLLDKRGVAHEVLNAKQHTREAEIVAQAGRLGSVTVATNMAGRGVDILLGGNPEGLARRDLRAQGLDPDLPEHQEQLEELVEKYAGETQAEGNKVREVGGLYVLGTERHESRRIDNQLRGRAGRQGDPGESRFYLSLEDDLMRLFKAQMVERVMSMANVPDDVPIENKMVTRAIASAQSQVEQQNFETRKNVLKYDEVLNEQRKVIYALRDQVLDKRDLRERILEEHLPNAVTTLVQTYCVADYHDEWDVAGLHTELLTFWPTTMTVEQLAEATTREELQEMLLEDGVGHYERREQELSPEVLRQVERQVMLRIIDTRWREHLYEMDYLQEGINLRAMGQRDPLTEWQREGFEMFGQMMQGIAQDLLRYVMHVQVEVSEPAKAQAAAAAAAAAEAEAKAKAEAEALADAPKVALDWTAPTAEPTQEADAEAAIEAEDAAADASESTAASDPIAASDSTEEPDSADSTAATESTEASEPTEPTDAAGDGEPEPAAAESADDAAAGAESPSVVSIGGGDAEVQILGYSMPEDPSSGAGMAATPSGEGSPQGDQPDTLTPIVKSEWDKTARNAPCPCGSGKKYKRCHGSNAA
jgi:preprotein translocase subunit SecA